MTEVAEYRARVLSVGQFDWLEQLTPGDGDYDEKGIRRIGGKLADSEDVKVQSVRFSKAPEFGWTREKIAEWLDENDFEIDQLKAVKPKTYKRWKGRKQEIDFEIISEFKIVDKAAYKPGEDLIVEGIISSDSIDAHEEIVDPDAVMESVPWFMKFPTFRNMHQADSIGVVLKIWKVKNQVWARMRIDSVESKIIQKVLKGTLRAFSIGFRVVKMEQFCPHKDEKGNLKCYWKFTKIMLIEISLVDTPANRDAKLTRAYYKSLIAPKWVKDSGADEYKTTAIIDDVEPPKTQLNAVNDCPDNTCPGGVIEFDVVTESDVVEEVKVNLEKKSGVNIHKKVINKPFHDFDTNQLKVILRGIQMENDEEIQDDNAAEDVEDTPEVQEPVVEEDNETPGTEEPTETEPEDKSAAILDAIKQVADGVKANAAEIAKMKMSEEERKEAEKIEAKVAEQLKAKEDELAALKAANAELEKQMAIKDEVAKQLGKAPPTKRSLSSESEDEDDEGETELKKAQAQMARQLQAYAAPPPE